MNMILEFLKKWGTILMVVISISIMFNTCGVKSSNRSLRKEIEGLKAEIHQNDSINREINSIEREISILETANEIVYTNNAIVRTVERPDDVMQKYSQRIKDLKLKLDKIKNAPGK